MDFIVQIYNLLLYISPFIAGTITTIVIPLLIKTFTKKSLDSTMNKISDNVNNKLSTHDERLMIEIKKLQGEISQLRGRPPKE